MHDEVGGQPDLLKAYPLQPESSIKLTSFKDEDVHPLVPESTSSTPFPRSPVGL